MAVSIVEINSIDIPTSMDLVRRPPRNPKDQQAGYLDKFDFHGVFSDIFYNGTQVVAVGPPYLNLREHLEEGTFRLGSWEGRGRDSASFKELNRCSRTVIDPPKDSDVAVESSSLTLTINGRSLTASIGNSEEKQFAGLNCLVTVSRDNPLENIRDWVVANVAANEIDGLLFFDNRSLSYGVNDLVELFSEIPGLKNVVVVNWDVAYGVTGGPSRIWDSDFGQHIAWEVARRRFLGLAKSVTINDVDEIALSEDGRPAWSLAQESPGGVFYCPQRDICPVTLDQSISRNRVRLHRDFYLIDGSPVGATKYTYLPDQLREDQQLLVHCVTHAGWDGNARGYTRHFRGLHRMWRKDSNDYTFEESSVSRENLQIDDTLVRLFHSLSWIN